MNGLLQKLKTPMGMAASGFVIFVLCLIIVNRVVSVPSSETVATTDAS